MFWRSLLGVIVLTSVAAAQITISAGSIPATGSYTEGEVEDATFSVGSGGANQTWTFGDYDWDEVWQVDIVPPGSTPFGNEFPTATRAERQGYPGTNVAAYLFERVESGAFLLLGYVMDFDTVHYVMPFTPPAQVPLPVSYQSAWTHVIRHSHEVYPGITYTEVDSVTNNVDGWGTCQTPYGSHEVLRMFEHHWVTISITGMPPQSYEYVAYTWLNQQANRVVGVQSPEDVTDPNFTEGSLSMMGVPLAAKEVRGPVAERFSVGQNYPNPFNPVTTLPLEMPHNARVTLDIYDATGRLVSSRSFELSAGHHDLPVDGSAWAAGTYFARLRTAGGARTVKMHLLK